MKIFNFGFNYYCFVVSFTSFDSGSWGVAPGKVNGHEITPELAYNLAVKKEAEDKKKSRLTY